MTKDFSEVKKVIPGLGVTKRQLFGFMLGAAVGLPVFFLLRFGLQLDSTLAMLGLAATAGPVIFIIMREKNGMYMEKHVQYWYETHFIRNTDRPYATNNIYSLMQKEEELKKEVEQILFRGKTPEEMKAIQESGETRQIKVGRKKLTIPMTGRIDRNTKKELEKAVKKAKLKGDIPESAQDTIPYKVPYPDGIFESDDGYFTQTIAFEDITYQLLDNDPKNILFEWWCKLINYFEPEIHFQFNYGNMEIDRDEYSRDFKIPFKEDTFNLVRKEYSDMLISQFSKGTNNLKKERYLTYGIKAADYKTAKLKLGKINKQLEKNFRKLNCKAHIMDGYERLHLLFRLFHPATKEKFMWNFDMPVGTGLSSKDFIAPSSFCFRSGPELNATRYFRVGERIGAVNYVKVFASDMEDRIISDILNMDSNVWISIHSNTVMRQTALEYVKNNITDIDGMIINEQRTAVQSGYDMDILPPDLKMYKDAANKLYKAIQRKDENMFNTTITIVQTAMSRKELEDNIFELNGILNNYQCTLVRLDNRQEQGYMSAMPLGNNTIEAERTFTTTDMAIFIPFTTKDLYTKNGQYYGMNSLSNSVITVNRKDLVNPKGVYRKGTGTPRKQQAVRLQAAQGRGKGRAKVILTVVYHRQPNMERGLILCRQ